MESGHPREKINQSERWDDCPSGNGHTVVGKNSRLQITMSGGALTRTCTRPRL